MFPWTEAWQFKLRSLDNLSNFIRIQNAETNLLIIHIIMKCNLCKNFKLKINSEQWNVQSISEKPLFGLQQTNFRQAWTNHKLCLCTEEDKALTSKSVHKCFFMRPIILFDFAHTLFVRGFGSYYVFIFFFMFENAHKSTDKYFSVCWQV